MDRAGLDLIDVEQRVQHARHGTQRLIQSADQLSGLVAFDVLSQQSLHQREGLQRLAKVVACRRQESRLRGVRQICLPFCDPEFIRHTPPFGDVGKGDDNPFHAVILRPVRQDSTDKAGARLCFDLPLRRLQGPQHQLDIGQQSAVLGQRVQIRQRASDIAGKDTEQRLRGRREEADVQVFVEEQCRDIGAVKDVLQIVGSRALPFQRFLQLTVQRGQFLVQRL